MTPDPAAEADADRPESPAEPPEPVPEGDHPGDLVENDQTPNRREARFRKQLREVEAERDGLLARVENLQRAEIERLAAAEYRLARPAALWASGVTIAELLDADGRVDPGKVQDATAAAVQTLGLALRPKAPRRDPGQGPRPTERPDPASWSEFLGSRK